MNKKLHDNLDDKIMKRSWENIPLNELCTSTTQLEEVNPLKTYRMLGIKLWGEGAYERDSVEGTQTQYKFFTKVQSGDLVLNKIWARNGAVTIIPDELQELYVSPEYPVFTLNHDIIQPKWLFFYTKHTALWKACDQMSRGTSGKNRIRPENFLKIQIPLPPLEEQQQIVTKLEMVREHSGKIRKLRSKQGLDIDNLLYSEYLKILKDVPWKKMEDIAPITRRPVEVKPNGKYPELGIRSFGKGTFHKPRLTGVEVGTKKLYQIKTGDLMFSNVFAWEGAIAVASEKDNDRVGSHRFISCVPDLEQVQPHFLCYHFLSPKGMEDINFASPGGAGRNRTLGLKKLEKIEVPIPPIEKQREFEALQKQLNQLRDHYNETNQNLDDLFPALLDKAFKGELVSMESLLINAS